MINVNDIKNGMTIKHEGVVYQIIEFQHVKPGKGSAFVRTKLKNIKANSTIEITFNAGIKLEKANIEKKQLTYLYNNANIYVFMDTTSYDQIEIDSKLLEDKIKFLKENLNVDIITFENEIIGISLPDKVSYKVINAEEAVKGNTTSGALKDITIETGYTLKAPLFISNNEEVIISTVDGKYVSRA